MAMMEVRKRLASMKRKELQEIVGGVIDALYLEGQTLNPEKEWSPDTLDEIAGLLETARLHPARCGVEDTRLP